ncbi:HAMP domain-containing sensor histidine kinase [Acidithiobacillus sp.]|uniref:sensor histidine kinase n=1 Tax=Acidithiobacillus sp. TaxID=1872118 RepID=UPI0025C65B9D|nr:HAMP domain-containing sensor histidine kinase [Acidithiobacillus sp.]MCK9189182.1 HAMP domain-containing histidine kinase [Acidithiobacillus sp.]MCK9359624.1 HAMP domain-containing histidine kinase [Acidithiobacillus sp.]
MAADLMEGYSTEPASAVPTRGEHHRADSIPRRVLVAALAILLLVGGVVYVAVRSIHILGNSSDTLVQVGLPLQKQLLKIKDTQRQAEFFRQLAQVLPQAGYEKTFAQLITSEEHDLQTLQRATRDHPALTVAMQQLQSSLAMYAQTTGDGTTEEASKATVEEKFRAVHLAVATLLARQGAAAAAARTRAIQILYALVFITALLSILIPWRVATALTRPLKDFRRAVEDIGAGKLTNVASEGPQELRDLARSIESMQARLREEERLRHEFLSQVSHELITPLASARSGSELLLSERIGPLLPRQHEVLEIIVRQVKELYAAIQEMLDMHALQARSLDFSPQDIPITEVLVDLQKRMQPLTDKKNQILDCNGVKELSVYADPQRLRQILTNLVSNAHKYSPAGGRIEVRATAQQGGILFSVGDNGPGIPEALLERVFERFYQVPVSNSLPRGTGLGLAITRELVGAQGGWIRMHNRPSGGLYAEIWLPAARNAGAI